MGEWRGEMREARIVPFRPADSVTSPNSLFRLLRSVGTTAAFAADAEIFGEQNRGEYIYGVVAGGVRICEWEDGVRKIIAFYLPGEVFGLERGELRNCFAETTGASTIIAAKRSDFLLESTLRCSAVAQLLAQTMRQMRRFEEHERRMRHEGVQARIVAFLSDIAERMSAGQGARINLPPADLAAYLDVSVEAVERVMDDLLPAPARARGGRVIPFRRNTRTLAA